jgi:hypothetical protein
MEQRPAQWKGEGGWRRLDLYCDEMPMLPDLGGVAQLRVSGIASCWMYTKHCHLHRVHRDEIRGSVLALSVGAYTATLLVMAIVVKGGGREPPTLTIQG